MRLNEEEEVVFKMLLLVNLPYATKIYSGLNKAAAVQPPLGLAYIASYVRERGVDVELVDCNALEMTMEATVEHAAKSKHEFVGVTSTTNTIYLAFEFARKLKEKAPEKKIIAGGVHVTFVDEGSMQECPEIDIIVRNEGEKTTHEIVSGAPLESIKGITYRAADGSIHRNPDADLILDLNSLPFPARDLLPMDKYRPGAFFNIGKKGKHYMTMISSRGCPNKCVFCSSSHYWRYLRLRSPDNIIKEIDELHEKYGVKHIHFLDDTLTVPKQRIERICDLLIERKYGIEWNTYSRVDVIDEALVSKMVKAGCFGITFGVESGNQEILNKIRKNITLDQVRNAVRICKKAGIDLHCDFMVGLPGDDEKTMQDTIDFALELDPNIALFSITTPFPGTELYRDLKEKGILENVKWSDASLHGTKNVSNGIVSAETIRKYYKKAYNSFYFRPKFFAKSLKRLATHPREIYPFLLGGAYMLTEKR